MLCTCKVLLRNHSVCSVNPRLQSRDGGRAPRGDVRERNFAGEGELSRYLALNLRGLKEMYNRIGGG